MRDYCECCHKLRACEWYVIDDNMESTLCRKCAPIIRKSGMEVDRLLVRS